MTQYILRDETTIRVSELLFLRVKKIMERYDLKFLTLLRTLLNYFNKLSKPAKVKIINSYLQDLNKYKNNPPYKIKQVHTYKSENTLVNFKKGLLSFAGDIAEPVYFNDICLILLIFFCRLDREDKLKFIDNHYKMDRGYTFIQDIKNMGVA
jgi:hypothetical protein